MEALHGHVGQWHVTLGFIRDVVFLGAGVLYFFGYLIWLFYASSQSLGPIPALDGQYLVSGSLFVGAIMTPVVIVLILKHWVAAPIRKRWSRRSVSTLRVVLQGVAAMIPLTWVILFLTDRIEDDLSKQFWVVSFLVLTVLGHLLGDKSVDREVAKSYARILLIPALTFFFVIFLSAYGEVPATLGGGAPRCVELDVKVDQMSPLIQDRLLASSDDGPVARTVEIAMYYQDQHRIFLKIWNDRQSHGQWAFQLSQSAVTAISPCTD